MNERNWRILESFIIVIFFVVGLIVGANLSNPTPTQSGVNDLNKVLESVNVLANHVQSEAQCLTMIKKCQLLEDNNIGFQLGCLK